MTSRKTPDWTAIGRLYRAGKEPIVMIALSHGVSPSSISRKARDKGWERTPRAGTAQSNAEIRQRLRELVERKLEQLEERLMSSEAESPADSAHLSREIGSLIQHHGRLEAMEEAAGGAAKRKPGRNDKAGEVDDAERWREELAKRIARLCEQWSA
jgi:hypothetical protein